MVFIGKLPIKQIGLSNDDKEQNLGGKLQVGLFHEFSLGMISKIIASEIRPIYKMIHATGFTYSRVQSAIPVYYII